MIRMLFALITTLAAFLVAALWWARDAAPLAVASHPAPRVAPTPEALSSAASLPAPVTAPPAREDVLEEQLLPPSDRPFVAPDPEAVALPKELAPPLEQVVAAHDGLADPSEDVAAPSFAETPAAEPLDQERWARLIRRMLSLYRRTGSGA